jgi:molybdate/tungstate transport system substrate-binding protein
MDEMGQPPFMPCRVSSEKMKNRLPKPLQSLVEVKE